MKVLVGVAVLAALALTPAQQPVRILVYTKNGVGYVHDNIPAAVRALRRLGAEHGMTVDVSDDPATFTERNLQQYTVLVFASTNNVVFDTDAQRLALRRYIEGGGGFVGLHSVAGTERNWPWFKMMIGGTFNWHSHFQTERLRRIEPSHPSVQGVPDGWTHDDECYFLKELYPAMRVVLAHDIHSLHPDNPGEAEHIQQASAPFADYYPAAWYHPFDGGMVWVTMLGHDQRDYEDPVYLGHIWGGIQFVAGQSHRPDFSRAYAATMDAALR